MKLQHRRAKKKKNDARRLEGEIKTDRSFCLEKELKQCAWPLMSRRHDSSTTSVRLWIIQNMLNDM